MSDRAKDWLLQAESDIGAAQQVLASGHLEWACFASQQAAEKAAKAVHLAFRQEPCGHVVGKLLQELPIEIDEALLHAAKVLDLYYISARYPDGFAEGAPHDHFSRRQAEEALEHARAIIEFARGQLVP